MKKKALGDGFDRDVVMNIDKALSDTDDKLLASDFESDQGPQEIQTVGGRGNYYTHKKQKKSNFNKNGQLEGKPKKERPPKSGEKKEKKEKPAGIKDRLKAAKAGAKGKRVEKLTAKDEKKIDKVANAKLDALKARLLAQK